MTLGPRGNLGTTSSLTAAAVLLGCGLFIALAQEAALDGFERGDPAAAELPAHPAECEFLGARREQFLRGGPAALKREPLTSAQTLAVTAKLGVKRRAAAAAGVINRPAEMGTIDRHLFQVMQDAGVQPAQKTNDFEFARRVTLDLTGRVPTPERLLAFVGDSSADKRARLVDELLASQAWVDKWTMFFGDLFKNTARTSQVSRYPEGRNAFYRWIRASLSENKSYDRIARELITATGGNSYEQGELNWLVGGLVTGGPRSGQDNFDQQAANVAETFLGIAHMNCILCHDGRRHLDTMSLWGKNATRYEAWELASFFSQTVIRAHRVVETNRRYYSVADVRVRPDYPLNTLTGNRPPRQPMGTVENVKPRYPFSGDVPGEGETYRAALAREVTADPQFARALVNYIWKEFFSLALVEPPNQFDPARLDPDNPPPEPWTLQPFQPRLLNALARDFIDSGYDLKALMRQIVLSDAYQLSSHYEGEWKPEYEPLFARKYVRRLWAEEIHDAIVQTSGVPAQYRIAGIGVVDSAMLFPEPAGLPGARNPVSEFLDAFLRGDRDEEMRRPDGSPVQALRLMNHPFVVERVRARRVGDGASLAARVLQMNDSQAVDTLFLTILSRYPTEQERALALESLRSGERRRKVEDLQWALYNKVDFIFNY